MVLFHRQPGFLMVRERSSSHRVCYTYLLMWSGHERFFRAKRRWFGPPQLVYRLLNPLSFVAFKMGRLRGGPSRTGAKGAYLAHSTRCRLLRAFDALPHAARVTCVHLICLGWLAMSKRQRVEWIDT